VRVVGRGYVDANQKLMASPVNIFTLLGDQSPVLIEIDANAVDYIYYYSILSSSFDSRKGRSWWLMNARNEGRFTPVI